MAQSNDFTQSELMSTESGEPSFSVAKVDSPILRISPADLDTLVGTLEVRQVTLEECTLKGERRFEPANDGMTRLYYGMCGTGSLTTTNGLSIAIAQHTLVVVPPIAANILNFEWCEKTGPCWREARVFCVAISTPHLGTLLTCLAAYPRQLWSDFRMVTSSQPS